MGKAATMDMRAAEHVEIHEHAGLISSLVVLVGRACFSAIFLLAAPNHFSQRAAEYAAQNGVPMASVLVPASGALAGLGALSVLLGYRARVGAWMLVAFLVPVTLMMHNFWAMPDPAQAAMQQGMFMKNLGLLGGALMITQFGSGPASLNRH